MGNRSLIVRISMLKTSAQPAHISVTHRQRQMQESDDVNIMITDEKRPVFRELTRFQAGSSPHSSHYTHCGRTTPTGSVLRQILLATFE